MAGRDPHRQDQAPDSPLGQPPLRRRYRPPRIVPLELWDLQVGDTTLYGARDRANFPSVLGDAVRLLRAGLARNREGQLLDPRTSGIDFLFVGGGGLARDGVADALTATGIPTHFDGEGRFVGIAGGRVLAGADGLVIDLGQTAIKLATSARRLAVARDPTRLPVGKGALETAVGRARLRDFLVEAIERVWERAAPIRSVALALPTEIDDALGLAGSSYPGMEGDRTLVADVLERVGLAETPTLVLNDAELAAVSAQTVVPAGATALVLTLGHGVGGALVLPLR